MEALGVPAGTNDRCGLSFPADYLWTNRCCLLWPPLRAWFDWTRQQTRRVAVMFLKHPLFCALLLLGTGRPSLAARPLLVFLIDGFRHDYMDDLQNLPGFRELVDNGVKVDYMTPDFPSLSFPNYYTLMTGNQSLLHD